MQTEKIRLDENHVYWLGQHRVPGFSEIIKSLGMANNPFWNDEGRDKGTSIHLWTIFLARGEEPIEPPDSRIAGRVDAFRKFMSESGFKFAGGEEPLYEPGMRFACTPDLYGHLGAFSAVVDIKNGAKEKWHGLQLGAQRLALAANGFKAQKKYGLYLRDGDYRLIEYPDAADESRWKTLVTAFYAKGFYD